MGNHHWDVVYPATIGLLSRPHPGLWGDGGMGRNGHLHGLSRDIYGFPFWQRTVERVESGLNFSRHFLTFRPGSFYNSDQNLK